MKRMCVYVRSAVPADNPRESHMKHNDLRSVQHCSPVICSADDALVIKANTTHELLVTFKYPQTGTTIDVPQSITHTHTRHIQSTVC